MRKLFQSTAQRNAVREAQLRIKFNKTIRFLDGHIKMCDQQIKSHEERGIKARQIGNMPQFEKCVEAIQRNEKSRYRSESWKLELAYRMEKLAEAKNAIAFSSTLKGFNEVITDMLKDVDMTEIAVGSDAADALVEEHLTGLDDALAASSGESSIGSSEDQVASADEIRERLEAKATVSESSAFDERVAAGLARVKKGLKS